MKDIENIFGLNKLQGLITLHNNLTSKGFNIDDLIVYVEDRKKELDEETRGYGDGLKCPECEHPLSLLAVNTNQGNQTGDDSKSVWHCNSCTWQKYNEQDVPAILTDMNNNKIPNLEK